MHYQAETDPAILTITAITRLAVDSAGNGPSASAIRTYVADGVLPAIKDNNNRLLFRRSDAARALVIYQTRRHRSGGSGQLALEGSIATSK